MGEEEAKSMITSNPKLLGGKPVMKGTRLPVEFIRGLLEAGWSQEQVLENYPQLSGLALHEVQAYPEKILETSILSEAALAEDWERPEEGEAWKHL